MPLRQGLSVFPRLEGIPQRELDQTRRSHRTGDFAEWRRRQNSIHAIRRPGGALKTFHVGERWVAEVRMVPNVEEVGREPQLLPFGDLEVLHQREVPVLLARASERVASEVSKTGGAEIGIAGALRRVQQRRRCERRGIQVAIDARADASRAEPA